uniref:F-box domain-containing protein n=1 Tax=Moniliophthora roreri TaxID=221103 RepID=A0A0W0EYZ8_MONRR
MKALGVSRLAAWRKRKAEKEGNGFLKSVARRFSTPSQFAPWRSRKPNSGSHHLLPAHRLPPAHHLPAELLIAIFELCVWLNDSNKFIFKYPYCHIESPVLTLSQVCSHWRSLTYSASILWGHISIEKCCHNPLITPNAQATLRILKMHFDRSGDAPLELSLNATRSTIPGLSHSHAIMETLLMRTCNFNYCDRLRRLETTIYITSIPGLDRTKKTVFAELETLSFTGEESLDQFSFPKLRHVSISVNGPRGALNLPWRQLTSLSFRCPHTTDFGSILNECPGLISLSLCLFQDPHYWYNVATRTPMPFPPQGHSTLKRLKNLSLKAHNYNDDSAMPVLKSLICPCLASLSLIQADTHSEYIRGFHAEGVIEFILRSQCQRTLDHLEIIGVLIHESSLLDLLRLTPCLTFFAFKECVYGYGMGTGSALFSGLTSRIYEPKERELVPSLRDIRVTLVEPFPEAFDDSLDAFEAMVRSRVQILHSASISVPDGTMTSQSARYQGLLSSLQEMQKRKDVEIALKVVVGDIVLVGYGDC